ncbi:Ig-like domain-containing protein [Gimesia maris]|uniref:Ig-like domain-containing protein n=1 Tax=Gimesia maris TaxID=122 RepID=UPI0012D39F49|nr:Ig-like domain-containing protein [Gimesia maris]QGQ30125.1 tandem-95 repeat protein [Gimesia maris]
MLLTHWLQRLRAGRIRVADLRGRKRKKKQQTTSSVERLEERAAPGQIMSVSSLLSLGLGVSPGMQTLVEAGYGEDLPGPAVGETQSSQNSRQPLNTSYDAYLGQEDEPYLPPLDSESNNEGGGGGNSSSVPGGSPGSRFSAAILGNAFPDSVWDDNEVVPEETSNQGLYPASSLRGVAASGSFGGLAGGGSSGGNQASSPPEQGQPDGQTNQPQSSNPDPSVNGQPVVTPANFTVDTTSVDTTTNNSQKSNASQGADQSAAGSENANSNPAQRDHANHSNSNSDSGGRGNTQRDLITVISAARGLNVAIDGKGQKIENLRTFQAEEHPGADSALPYGMFEFNVTDIEVGGSTTVDLILPEGSNVDTYYKLNPDTGDLFEFTYDGETGATIDGNIITLHLVDGGRGDFDGIANGVIADPGGPGVTGVISLMAVGATGLDGWTVTESGGSGGLEGSVVKDGNDLLISEGNSYQVSLERDITIPDNPSLLSFAYEGNFDITSTDFINDAFEVALLDQNGETVVPSFLYQRDAYFNITEGELPTFGTTTNHLVGESGSTLVSGVVDLDISHLEVGSTVKVVLRLINDDDDTGTTFRIINSSEQPEADNDAYTVGENGVLVIAAPGVLSNDTAPGQGSLTAVKSTDPSHGAVVLNSDGSFTYTPDTDFVGTDSFTYIAQDGTYDSYEATVSIVVTGVNAPPIANDDTKTTSEDTAITFPAADLIANDSVGIGNETGQTLTVTSVTATAETHGTVVLNGDGTITFTPDADYNGSANFEYTVSDDGTTGGILDTKTDTGTVTVSITEVNDAPTANPDIFETTEDTGFTFNASNLIVNDSAGPANEGSQVLSVTAVSATADTYGSVVLNGDGTITFTPNADFNGTASFEYTLADDGTTASLPDSQIDLGLVTIIVAEVNDGPTANNDAIITSEDSAITFAVTDLLTNDESGPLNEAGQTLSVSSVTATPDTHGTVVLNGDGTITYTPDADFNGTASFDYTIEDDGTTGGVLDVKTATATVNVTINAINDTPTANNDSFLVAEDSGTTLLDVLNNDSISPDLGETLTVVNVSAGSAGGTIEITNGGTGINYTPAADFNGTETFTYTINDGTVGSSDVATVTITVSEVNDAPVATVDAQTTTEDTPLTFSASDLVTNDSVGPANESGQSLTVTAVTATADTHGTVVLNGDGTITFTPDADFNGSASFEYMVTDDGTTAGVADAQSTTGVVNLTISEVNDAPTAGADTVAATEDSPLTFAASDLLTNDNAGPADESGQTLTVTSVSATADTHGTVVLNGDGTITFTPDADYNGAASFEYTITDDGTTNSVADSMTAVGTVNLDIAGVNDAPTAGADGFTVSEDSTTTLDVLSNDSIAPDFGETLSIVSVGTGSAGGTVTIANGGADLSYTPAADFVGTETFTYTINDGTPGSTDQATVTITVTEVNDAPVTADDLVTTSEDNALTFNAADLLLNDQAGPANESGQTLTVTAVVATADTHGTVVLNGDGTITYTPDADFNGTASFAYTVTDDGTTNGSPDAQSTTGTVNITISEVNDGPTAVADNITATEDTPLTFTASDLVANDSAGPANESGQTLTVTAVTATADTHGTVVLNGDGTITFTPDADFNGTASFDYTVSDNGTTEGLTDSLTDIGAVTITVSEVNDDVTAVDDAISTAEDVAITFTAANLVTNDSAGPISESSQTLTVTSVTATADTHGTVVLNGDGTITFTPDADFHGTASFDYTVSDNGTTNGAPDAQTDVGTVTVTITDVNDAPLTVGDVKATTEDTPLTFTASDLVTNDSPGPADEFGQTLTLTAVTATAATHGTVVLNGDGTITFTPDADFNGTASFEYTVTDDGTTNSVLDSQSSTGTVTITVNEVNDGPTAIDDVKVTAEDVALVFTATDLVTNDSAGPANESSQTLTVTSVTATVDTHGTVVLNGDGTITFTPDADFNGTASFEYTISDDGTTGGLADHLTDTGTVTITVTEVNDVPLTVGDSKSGTEDISLTFNASDLVANDSTGPADESGQALTVTAVTATADTHGTVVLNGDGTITYTPDANYNGSASFEYTVTDDGTTNGSLNAKTAVGTVTLDIAAVNDSPIANDDSFSVAEDSTTTFDVLNNDSIFPDLGETLSIIAVGTGSAGGTIVITNGGADLSYTPAADFTGTETFTYVINDGAPNNNATATVTVTVSEVNDTPLAATDQISASEDNSVTFNASDLLVNDQAGPVNESSQTLIVTAVAATANTHGTVVLNGDNTITFTPDADFNGSASFEYTVTDDGTTAGVLDAKSTTGIVNLTVGEVNDNPTAVDDTQTAAEDMPLVFSAADLVANDSAGPANESSQTLTVTSVTATADTHGTVALNGDGTITFTPDADYVGIASFDYTVSDNGTSGGSADYLTDVGSVTITVTEVNDAPTTTADTQSTVEETPLTFTAADLVTNDSPGPADESAQTLTVTAVSATADTHGTVILNGDGTITYTPAADFNGTASFEYTVTDNGTTNAMLDPQSSTGTVNVTVSEVNDAPVTVDDIKVTAEDTALTFTATDLVINDSAGPANESGQTLTVTSVTATANTHGTVVLNGDGTITFTPDADFNGTASFDYTVTDNGTTGGVADQLSDTGTVTITVTEVNDVPISTADTKSAVEDTPLTFSASDLVSNDSAGPANESGQTLTVTTVTATANTHGSVVLNGDGTITFTPDADFNGNASFEYTVTDNGTTAGLADAQSTTGVVNLTISEVNDAPTASTDTVAGTEDTPLTFAASDLLINDSAGPADESGQTLTVTSVSVTADTHGTVVLNGDGTITFTPDADFNGAASFEYTITDDGTTNSVADSMTAVGTVNLNIAGVNDAPTAGADGFTVSEDSTTTLDVLSNDSIAPDFGETLSIVSVGSGSAGGTISITNGGADLSYTPAADFVGTETFTYTINDGTPGSTDQATVTITVTEVNDVPVTADDLVTTSEDSSITFNAADLLLNDQAGPANESGQTLTVTAVSATADTHGTVVLNGDGTITYTPDADFNGTSSFAYTVTDDGTTDGSPDAQSNTGTVNVTVSEVNDGPTANTDSIVAVEDTPLTFTASDLMANDNAGPADESGQTLTVTAVTATADTHGTVVLNGDGTITFTPDADFNGTASFDYTVSDNGTTEGLTDSLSDLGSVTVLVTEVNDAPLTAGDTQSATEDTPLTFAASELLTNDSTGPANESNQTLTVTAVTATADTHGTVVLNGDGTITFTPDTDFNGTASFEYTVSDNGTTAGAPDAKTASDTVTVNISAVNDAPTVVVPDTSADEGETVNLVATFTDPEPGDIHTAIIHWGDGTTEVGTVIEVNGSGTITGSHIYADNGNYTITVEVTDDGSPVEAASASGIATIGNVAPYLSAGIGFSPVENGSDYEMSFVISGYFDDPGFDSLLANTSESFTMIIDWGDGTVINVTPAVTQGAEGQRTKGYFSESHVYTQTGTYNPTVTVTDDDGGTTSVTLGSILPISINVHPHIQLSAQGRLPVTVYGDQGVDLSLIDSSTVRFGPAGAPPTPGHGGWQLKGNGDVKAHFETQETGIRITDKVGFLTGQLTDGTFFIGMDVLDFAQGNKKGKGNAGVVTEDPNPAGDSKFFVADNGVHRVFRYDSAGASTDSIAVDSAARDVRGATVYDENPDDNIQPVLWTVGGAQQVAVQKVDGTLIGSWRAVGIEDPQGIATGGDDIWIVDAATHQVLRYVGYGHQSAFFGVGISSSSFALHQDNVSPSGITTDGDTIWVVDDVADRVFVYDVAGTYLGSWDLDPANSDAAGITIALNDSTSIWVVDRNDDRVYRYDDATGVRSGSLTAASTFDLIGDNLNPEGIADPDPNQAPVATNDTVSDVIGGVAEVIDVLANDTDPESDAISVTSVSTPHYGTAVINGDGTISYTGTIGFGTDTFTYTISDTSSATSTATVTVTETGNYPPTAVNDSVNDVLEGQAVVISVLSNDTDPESDTLSITALSTPAYGTAVDNGDGTITYTAGTGFSGDSFTYSISDGNGHTSTATVTIYEAVNQPPVAYSTTLDPVEAGVETIISVIANSTDPEADTLTVVSVSTPLNGTAVDNGDGTISYTGNASFGTDSFTYTISDGNGNTDTGTINVTELVDLPPIAADDFAYEVAGGSPVIIDVLGNDADPEAGTLSITSLSTPTSGTAVDNGDGTITYTGPLGFGSVSFSYTVSDPGGNTDTAIVSIYELIAVDDAVSVTAGSTVTIDVLTNDNYPSGTTLTLLSANGASHGTTTLQRRIPAALQTEFEGSMEYEMGESIDNYVLWYYGSWDDYAMMSGNDVSIFDVLYSSTDGNYVGTDTFNYVVQNDQGVQDTGTVTITVNANQAPVAGADTATVVAGNSVAIEVLSNDSDPEGSAVSLVSLGTATYGTVSLERRIPVALQTEFEGSMEYEMGESIDNYVLWYYGSWDDYAMMSGNDVNIFDVTYTSTDVNYSGTDSFTYTIEDEQGVQSTGTVAVTVTGNQAPDAVADTATVVAGNSVIVDVLANDSDPEGSAVSLVFLGAATHGTVTQQRRIPAALQTEYEGSWEYSEGYSIDDYVSMFYGSWEQYENSSGNDASTFDVTYTSTDGSYSGTDTFTYTIQDEQGVQSTGTVTVTVTGNQAPDAVADTATVVAGNSVVVDVLANDSDPEGGTVSLVSLGTAAHGTVALQRRIPAALQTEYEGSWEYSEGYSIDDYVSMFYGSWEQYEISSGNDATTFDVIYTSTDGSYSGTDSFTYTIQDEQGVQSIGTATVTVTGNQAPDAVADTATVVAGNSTVIDVLVNDSDPEGTPLSLVSLGTATYGTVTQERRIPAALQSEYEGSWEYAEGYSIDDYVSMYYGSWEQYENSSGYDATTFDVIYTSTDGSYTGTDSFTYTIQDEQGVQSTGTVTVTVISNQAPDAVADTATVVAGNSVVIDVLANDSDPEGTTVSLISLGTATYGTVTQQRRIPTSLQTEYEGSWEYSEGYSIDDYVSFMYGSWEQYQNSSGNDTSIFDVTYTSTDANYSGTDSFTYTIQDEQGVQSTGTVTVTITGNQAPDAVADTASLVAGNSVVIDVLVNDSDPEGSAVSLMSLGTAAYGTVTLERRIPTALQTEYEGSWEYTEGYSIDDYVSFQYGSWEQYENSSGNDASIFDVTYTSTDANYSGTDTFTYTIQDEQGVQSTGTVTVTITGNQSPDAVADTATVVAGNSVVIDLLSNDSDPEGTTVSLVSLGTAAHGTVAQQRRIPAALQTEYEGSWEFTEGYSIDDYVSMYYGSWEQYENSSGNDATTFDVTYTSTDANYVGTDTFTYTIQDEQGVQSTGTVTVTVNENQAPTAVADTATVIAGNTVVIDIMSNDSDPEGSTVSLVLLGTATYGTVALQRRIPAALQTEYEGSWEYSEGGYSIDDYVSMYYGSWEQYELSSGNDATTFDVVYTGTSATYVGTDSFTYTIQDEQGVQGSGTVSVTINENQAPAAITDTASVIAGYSVVINVLVNDSDPEGSAVSLVSQGTAAHGTVTLERRIPAALQTEYEGSWEYSEGYSIDDYVSFMYGSWEQYEISSGNDASTFDVTYTSTDANYVGTDTFNYVVQDEQGVQSTGTVMITVNENQAPVVAADTTSVLAGNSVMIDVLANDSDPEGATVSLALLGTAAHGTVSLQRRIPAALQTEYEGSWEYTMGDTPSMTMSIPITAGGNSTKIAPVMMPARSM